MGENPYLKKLAGVALLAAIIMALVESAFYTGSGVPPFTAVLILALFAAVMVWSWICCGSDHEEDEEHPDGKLTYPGDENHEP